MKKYTNTVTDRLGNALNAATVTVVSYPSESAVTIYSDDGTTVVSGSVVTTNSLGEFSFYAPSGRYNLQVRVGGALVNTLTDVQIDVSPENNATDAELSASGGSALVGFLPSGTGAVARTVQAKLRDVVDARDFDVTGDGVADDYTALANFFTACAGKMGVIPAGFTCKITSGLTLPANTILSAWGATIQNTATHLKLLTLNSGCRVFGLSLTGASSTYNASGYGIFASGTRNGAGVAPTMLENIEVAYCKFNNIGNAAVEFDFVKNSSVHHNRGLKNLGYAGVFVYSGENVDVHSNEIDTITGETASGQLNAYGVTFTSLVSTADFVRDPQSVNCRAYVNDIANIPTWHAMDTHGGVRCDFLNNRIRDCRRGVILTNLGTAGASHCTAKGNVLRNTLSGTNSDGSRKQDSAFWDIGASGAVRNSFNRIVDNEVYQHGHETSTSGCVWIENAEDGECANNRLVEPFNTGVLVNGTVRRYRIAKNNVTDPKGNGTGGSPAGPTDFPQCLNFRNTDFDDISVSHNTFARHRTAAGTVVGEIGVAIANTALKSIDFRANQFDGLVTDWSFGDTTGLTGDFTGSFTATVTGMTAGTTGTIKYVRQGKTATLSVDSAITGTSNTTACTITGMPVGLRPAAAKTMFVRVVDNGAAALGVAIVGSDGTITLWVGATLNNFTAANAKGISAQIFSYELT